jgi:hypothetical protein
MSGERQRERVAAIVGRVARIPVHGTPFSTLKRRARASP